MINKILKYINFNDKESLFFVNQKDNENIGEARRKVLYLAQDDYLADAVVFQIKQNNKYIPQIFIYDNTNNNKFNPVVLSEIHKRLWSSEIIPLYFVLEETEIKIFNTKQKISINNKDEKEEITPTDILELSQKTSTEFQKKKNNYSAFLFQNGSFWETEYYIEKYLKDTITKKSPFEILIKNLHGLKKDIVHNQISPAIANKIVVFTILIKYLEEKKDENGNSVFTVKGNIFQEKWSVNNFSELIKAGKLYKLLNYLSEKFNGKIFELSIDEKKQITHLPQNVLNHLSDFVDANYLTKSDQLYLWRLYSFRYLPVELISRIYEEFIPDIAGVVYTPPFLVDLLIDECMPLDDYKKFEKGKYKIIDPACGSGIFCVSAYQRLIDWHIINKYQQTKKWDKELRIETLKEILVENIFGVDKEQEAVNIAVFSLILALLEKLTPIQLWEDLDFEDKRNDTNKKFKNLKEKNIILDNFFNFLQTAEKDFDLVIGNPPFIRQNFDKLKEDYKLQFFNEIPANLAILFLDQSIKLLKDKGLQCLILPASGILYNNGAMKYRSLFMQNYYVPQIIDFTHLRRKLFNKDVASCAFFTKKQKPENDSKTLHLISHNTANEENKMFFVFDTYDFHFVPLSVALTQKYVWKSNLVGGGRLNWIVDRLSRIKPTLEEFLIEKKQNSQWEYLDGYTLGKETATKEANFITGNYSIPENAFSEKGLDYSKIFIEKEDLFANKRNELVFRKPQILIKKTILKNGQVPIVMIDYNKIKSHEKVKNENILCFKHGISGIHYNENEIGVAIDLYRFLTNTTYNCVLVFYSILIGSVALVRREKAIGKDEVDKFPYPQTKDDKQNFQLSEVEKIWQEDVYNYYIHQGKASRNNPLNEVVNDKMLKNYADTFTWLMNLNYNPVQEKSFQTGKITKTKSYFAVEFHYCKKNIDLSFEEKTEEEYQYYFETQTGRNKKNTRIVEYIDFANNKIYYIKPHQKRYWLKSIADRDAMKSFADFGNNIYS